MTKRQLILYLTLSTMFLGSDRFLNAQRISDSDLQAKSSDKIRQAKRNKTKFLRMVKDDAGKPKSLETSITRYRSNDDKLLVDLIGVIHVGEADYYRKLNYQFKQYESLLYELVAPEGHRVPDREARGGGNPVHFLQSSMQRMLGLQSQLKHIDYSKSNFVHADLSPRQMQQKMAERGDTAWSLGIRAFSEMMQNQSSAQRSVAAAAAGDIESFEDLFSVINDPARLKVIMASQFADGGAMEAGLGSSLNQLLITDRNQAAMKVLESEIAKGKKTIAIFYGAAHMPDFEKRLVDDMGLRKTRQAWVEAWDLQSAPRNAGANGLAEMFFELIDAIE